MSRVWVADVPFVVCKRGSLPSHGGQQQRLSMPPRRQACNGKRRHGDLVSQRFVLLIIMSSLGSTDRFFLCGSD